MALNGTDITMWVFRAIRLDSPPHIQEYWFKNNNFALHTCFTAKHPSVNPFLTELYFFLAPKVLIIACWASLSTVWYHSIKHIHSAHAKTSLRLGLSEKAFLNVLAFTFMVLFQDWCLCPDIPEKWKIEPGVVYYKRLLSGMCCHLITTCFSFCMDRSLIYTRLYSWGERWYLRQEKAEWKDSICNAVKIIPFHCL